jgi:hypothetical protein
MKQLRKSAAPLGITVVFVLIWTWARWEHTGGNDEFNPTEALFAVAVLTCIIATPILALALLGKLLLFLPSRRHRKPHVCEMCGYDLRATLGRCPECRLGGQCSTWWRLFH